MATSRGLAAQRTFGWDKKEYGIESAIIKVLDAQAQADEWMATARSEIYYIFPFWRHQNKYVFSGRKVTEIFFANRKLLNVAATAVAVRTANEQNTNMEEN